MGNLILRDIMEKGRINFDSAFFYAKDYCLHLHLESMVL